jgi:hypothetical protein
MPKNGFQLRIFWGSALGLVLSEAALAQLAAARTPEERAEAVIALTDQAEVSAVGVDADGNLAPRAPAVSQTKTYDREWDQVAWDKWDKAEEPA